METNPDDNTTVDTTASRPEPLPQRWAIILIAGFVAGAAVFTLGGMLAALGAAGATVVALHQLMA
ncbi:hypothetical protein KPP03845_107286 [Streptomyces xanthophaeus]|uniref:hypothetical protein n=1 Tax=Streptomyces xanthophaeus TaxID=67385 RepID=UPI00233E9F1E|nr:hypothetical protein [Streptomyces xanthophaeus]WCD90857.1 hypothetical protein KPP03845_107286 [Streptomyces xanthophaeus]